MADAGSASCPSPAPTQQRLAQILAALRAEDRAEAFLSPAVEQMRESPDTFTQEDIADYEQTIAEPMDLGTVQQKLEQGAYGGGQHALFARDVKLIFENCMRYTPDEQEPIHIDAAELLAEFESEYERSLSAAGASGIASPPPSVAAAAPPLSAPPAQPAAKTAAPEPVLEQQSSGASSLPLDAATAIVCTGCGDDTHGCEQTLTHPDIPGCPLCTRCHDRVTRPFTIASDDGKEEQCRWCGKGGDLIVCDDCPSAFCSECIKRNVGEQAQRELLESDDSWSCYRCDPSPVAHLMRPQPSVVSPISKSEPQTSLVDLDHAQSASPKPSSRPLNENPQNAGAGVRKTKQKQSRDDDNDLDDAAAEPGYDQDDRSDNKGVPKASSRSDSKTNVKALKERYKQLKGGSSARGPKANDPDWLRARIDEMENGTSSI
jgi:hypothetical protein